MSMLSVWKFLLYFRVTGHTNYAHESVNLVAQVSSLLSERSAHQLKWCWFVNTKGTPGHNISCDLAMEHWNRAFKQHVHTAGGNVSTSTVVCSVLATRHILKRTSRDDDQSE